MPAAHSRHTLAENLIAVPSNVGPRTMPNYEALAAKGVNTLSGGIRVFAGQRDDPFFIDLGAVFDTLNLRPFFDPQPKRGVDMLGGFNVHTIALEVPASLLTADRQPISGTHQPKLGAYAATYREAITVSRMGLKLLATLPETDDRARQELQLQITLGVPLIAAEGYAAPQVGTVYRRARRLCERFGTMPQAAQVLWGLWTFHMLRAELATASGFAGALLELAQRTGVPVFCSQLKTGDVFRRLQPYLEDQLAPSTTCHGSLADVYGVGLLFTGRSGIGKSECVLDLVERGHRVVADDIVSITRRGNDVLIGRGTDLQGHHMEIRGIGLIDVKALFGIRSVRAQKRIEVRLDRVAGHLNVSLDLSCAASHRQFSPKDFSVSVGHERFFSRHALQASAISDSSATPPPAISRGSQRASNTGARAAATSNPATASAATMARAGKDGGELRRNKGEPGRRPRRYSFPG